MRATEDERPDRIPDTDERAGIEGASAVQLTWRALIDGLVRAHGSLTRVAELLAEARGYRDDVLSVERALRRLRSKETEDGGQWGRRVLARFGLPDEATARARWMGTYHARFTDLPVDACEALLRLWDQGPVRESRARVWIELGLCSVHLRREQNALAHEKLRRAHALLVGAHPAAEIEWSLCEAFVASRAREHERVQRALDRAKAALDTRGASLERDEASALHARWVDQQAFIDNHQGRFAQARARYESIAEDAPSAFARCRRENGLAYACLRDDDRSAAILHAERAARAAGDAGALRLRAMALLMLVKIKGPIDGADELSRAREISRSLGDHALLGRVARLDGTARATSEDSRASS